MTSYGQTSDSEQCSNPLQLDVNSPLVNVSCELGQIMTRYDFLCTYDVLEKWFWAIFKPSPAWHNFAFGQLLMWIGVNNDQITPCKLDEWFWFQLDPILIYFILQLENVIHMYNDNWVL